MTPCKIHGNGKNKHFNHRGYRFRVPAATTETRVQVKSLRTRHAKKHGLGAIVEYVLGDRLIIARSVVVEVRCNPTV